MRAVGETWVRTAVLMVFGVLFFLFIFGPFYWMVATSLMTEKEMFAVPPHLIPHAPTFKNYLAVLGIGDPEA